MTVKSVGYGLFSVYVFLLVFLHFSDYSELVKFGNSAIIFSIVIRTIALNRRDASDTIPFYLPAFTQGMTDIHFCPVKFLDKLEVLVFTSKRRPVVDTDQRALFGN